MFFFVGDGPKEKDTCAAAVDSMIVAEQTKRMIKKHELAEEVTEIESDLDTILQMLRADTLSGNRRK